MNWFTHKASAKYLHIFSIELKANLKNVDVITFTYPQTFKIDFTLLTLRVH
mgnify:FL=1|jgi:hypothetical protein